MKISNHADRTEAQVGIRAEEIHKWIDGFFDAGSFDHFLRTGSHVGFDPYSHRKYRHCAEALEDACKAFAGEYTRAQVKAVFECHIRDDYNGLIPLREDFESGAFVEKYHESDEPETILSEAEISEYFKGKSGRERPLSTGFYWRIVWPAVIAAVLFAASAFTVVVPVFRKSMLGQKKEMIRELTATAASAIAFYIHQEQRGTLSKEVAQQQAASEIAELRYGIGQKDYFWITDMHPRMIMHPYRPELIGHDLSGYTDREDKSGKKLFKEFVELVEKDGEGYLEYLWQWMDDPSRAEPKLSYVRGVPEWGWVIGTGVYIHDVEQEISRISRNLLVADGLLAVVLLGLLITILLQSRRIEMDRARAEAGLREAKDRYRALVESSSEGYILEVGGDTVYSNHTLRRMTGYDEAELSSMKVWELLDPTCEINEFAGAHLHELYSHVAVASEFEARLLSKHGAPLEVLISTSRIFFSEKNGHVISFSEITRGQQHTLEAFRGRGALIQKVPESDLSRRIAECQTTGRVIQVLKELPAVVRSMTDQGVHSAILRETIGGIYDEVVRRFVCQALEKMGEPPVSFAFLSLGSNARHEMTFFSDQDNALIFAVAPEGPSAQVRRWFIALADEVCTKLNQAGYPYCPGGIMAVNPKWSLSLDEWKEKFSHWIMEATPESILEVNVFFDVRCAYGDGELVQELRRYVHELTKQRPDFFIHFVRNCLSYKAPLSLLGRLRTERHGERKIIHMKACIKPLETLVRIYALRHGVSAPGTLDRLEALRVAGVLPEESCRELVYVFDYLWRIRFFNQIVDGVDAGSDELDISVLTSIERDNLQSVLTRISGFQTRLSYDFLGVSNP